MDGTIRVALIAASGAVAAAVVSAITTLWVSSSELRVKTREVEVLNQQAQSTLREASNLLRYVYDNGSLSSTGFAGGKMVVRVNGSNNQGPVPIHLDMNRFVEMCGDDDGCLLTLGATRFRSQTDGVADQSYIITAPLQGAPCRFFWDKGSGNWTLSQQCVAIYGLYAYQEASKQYEFSRAYQIYEYSNAYGTDDSGAETDRDGQPLIVMGFKGACYLAESAPDLASGMGKFLPDNPENTSTGKGLYLVASSPSWDYPGTYPHDDKNTASALWPADDPARRCELIVED